MLTVNAYSKTFNRIVVMQWKNAGLLPERYLAMMTMNYKIKQNGLNHRITHCCWVTH